MPNLTIVIVSWNVRDLLRRCLASVAAARDQRPSTEVIVVDGASADGSADMVEAEFPWVRVLRQSENVGFSRGNNLGLAAAGGRLLLLLNPDTEIVGDALTQMVRYLEAHPGVGALGPKLLYPDGRIQSSRRRFPTVATALFESTWLQPIAPQFLLRRYYVLDRPDDAISQVDWVTGACLMVRREAYQAAGPLDEGYFMYSEEMEWQRRIQAAGWHVVYYPEAEVIHHEGKSSEQVAAERHIYFQRSKLRYFYHYHGRLAGGILRAFLLLSYAWQLVLEAGKGVLGHKRPLRRQRVAAYWQVLRSGLPPAGPRKQGAG
jgi:N-acetylglucosaminyl-diphospho-decaprenol L-rhamnosyltransferase